VHRRRPRNLGEIAKIAAMPAGDRITYLGHATLLIELGSARVLTDPLLRSGFAHVRRQAPPVDVATLGRPDAVLVSHVHHDHLDLPSLRRLGRVAPLVVPRGAGSFLRSRGFDQVAELSPGEELRTGGTVITATSADHDDRRFGTSLRAQPLGFVIAAPGRRVYFAGDTDLFPGMAELAEPPLDVALVPVWGWGPSLGPGHLDPAEAARALALLRPRVAVPIHWGTFYPPVLRRLRPEPLSRPPREFKRLAAREAPGVDVCIIEPGGRLELS
jgi:L-ascorbate metabolism protein UlaG (beta-lactamase superfamily)